MNCPNCDNSHVSAVGPYRGTHQAFSNLALRRCERCELVFADPQPSGKELADYYARYWDGEVAVSTPSTRRYYFSQSLSRVHYLKRFEALPANPAVLDVGAGLGLFHDGLSKLGIRHTYVATETDQDQLRALRERLGSENAFVQLSDVPAERRFDLIVLSHVLEHMADPHAMIASLMQRLQPGGLLFIEVPNSDYRYKAIFESHLLFFNPKSLADLLARHGKVLDVSTVGRDASRLYIAKVHPGRDLLRPAKEVVKTLIALATPDFNGKQIDKLDMSRYGGDRQWLRAVVQRSADR
jgi:2-polyprenyl-3-methyl-5-hydroxy-6-metoxy-1,4-benzoquinol methylase